MLTGFIKKFYGKILRFEVIWRLRGKIVLHRKNKAVKMLQRLDNGFMDKNKAVTIDDTKFVELRINPSDDDNVVFGFDTLGQIDELEFFDYVEYGSSLQGIFDNGGTDIKVTFMERLPENMEALTYLQDEMNLVTLTPDTSYLVSCGEIKAAFVGLSIKRDGNAVIDEKTVKTIAYAKKIGVDYLVAYAHREMHKSTALTPDERTSVTFLANVGCNAIFCANSAGIHVGESIRRLDGEFVNSVSSMGRLFGNIEHAKGGTIAVRLKLVKTNIHKEYITNKGYIPLYNQFVQGNPYSLMRIDYHNGEHRRNKSMMDALIYIENESGKLRDIRNIMTLQDICNILELKLPLKYAYLGNASVGKVCARSFEVNSGDVLFFFEPFQDNNDGTPTPLEIRKRIVEKAIGRGARFIFSYIDLDDDIPHVKIANAREAHIKICAALRQMYEVRTIGITGSVGKTSTKDMLYYVLSEKFSTYRNLRNSNTQVNIGMHIQQFRGEHEVFIQAIGGGRPGGASRHSRMILPEATVITNIGLEHIGNYGSKEKILESKLGIVDGMSELGTLFLNGDDPLLRSVKVPAETVLYAVENKNADYYVEDIVEAQGKTFFSIVHENRRIPAVLNVPGKYNILNAVCCFAIAQKFGLKDEQIVEGISKFETSGVRQNIISVANRRLFIDCVNASPSSIDTSLSVLDRMETKKKKIAVIGDATGMAELSLKVHSQIGEVVKNHKIDELICYGNESKIVYDIVKTSGYKAVHITSPVELENRMLTGANTGDVILFKGGATVKFAERIDSVFGTMLADQGYIDRMEYKKVNYNGVEFNLYPDYATVVGCKDSVSTITIGKSIRGRKVYNLGDGAFSDKDNLVEVKVSNSIRHIGKGCFHGCIMMKKIELPSSVKYISERAFAKCNSLEKVTLEDGILHIAAEVFDGCISLESINIPASVEEIGEGVFDDCDNLTVLCQHGTYGEKYCEENGIRYNLK